MIYVDTLLYLGVTLEITLFRLITSCLKCKVCTLSDIEIKKFLRKIFPLDASAPTIKSMGSTAHFLDPLIPAEHESKALEEVVAVPDASDIDLGLVDAEACQREKTFFHGCTLLLDLLSLDP